MSNFCCADKVVLTRFLVRVTLGRRIPSCLETPSVHHVRLLGSKTSPVFVWVLSLPNLMTLDRTLCSTVLGIKQDAISEAVNSIHAEETESSWEYSLQHPRVQKRRGECLEF